MEFKTAAEWGHPRPLRDRAKETRRPHYHVVAAAPGEVDPLYSAALSGGRASEAVRTAARAFQADGFKVYAETVYCPAAPNGSEILVYCVPCQHRACLSEAAPCPSSETTPES